jgi:hypothetical protein
MEITEHNLQAMRAARGRAGMQRNHMLEEMLRSESCGLWTELERQKHERRDIR